jgi:hypothetical protein
MIQDTSETCRGLQGRGSCVVVGDLAYWNQAKIIIARYGTHSHGAYMARMVFSAMRSALYIVPLVNDLESCQ